MIPMLLMALKMALFLLAVSPWVRLSGLETELENHLLTNQRELYRDIFKDHGASTGKTLGRWMRVQSNASLINDPALAAKLAGVRRLVRIQWISLALFLAFLLIVAVL